MSVSLNGTNGLTFADSTTQNTGGYTGFRNRIINGDMRIDQRNAGASVGLSASNVFYASDRFGTRTDTGSGNTIQQTTTAPPNYTNSVLLTIGTGATPSAGAVNYFGQTIEGLNIADLGWGTPSAASITLSFWVRSSVAGTYGIGFRNSAVDRCYVSTYTVNSANTWEQKFVFVAGDTSGTWLKNNGVGLYLTFDIGEGASRSTSTTGSWVSTNTPGFSSGVKLAATSGATFYITGVQLEKGSVATPFEFRPYGMELSLCQRYYQAIGGTADATIGVGLSTTTSTAAFYVKYLNTMRAAPTVTGTSFYVTDGIYYNAIVSGLSSVNAGVDSARVFVNTNAVMTQFRPALLQPNASGPMLSFSAEL